MAKKDGGSPMDFLTVSTQPVHVDVDMVRQTCERTTAHHGARMAQIMLRNQEIGQTQV